MGTGTTDMIRKSIEAGLAEPQFIQSEDFRTILFRKSSQQVTDQVTPQDTMQVTMQDTMQVTMQVEQLIKAIDGIMSRDELQKSVHINNRDYFRKAYINEALQNDLIEMTISEKPNSKNQKYRLTAKGEAMKELLKNKNN